MKDDLEKSDGPMVPTKPSNKAERSGAERVEGRGPTKGNPNQQNAKKLLEEAQHKKSNVDKSP